MKRGRATAALGKDLSTNLKSKPGVEVWYDHGDPDKEPNVRKIQGYMGDGPSNLNNLAEVDIMITENTRLRYLIEVEETSSSPKSLLGEAITICMCEGFTVKKEGKHDKYAPDEETELLIGSWFNPKGRGAKKMEAFAERFKKFKGLPDTVKMENVSFIHADSLEKLIDKIKKRIISEL